MRDNQIIIRKVVNISLDGTTKNEYEIVAKDTHFKREVAMLTLTLEELETYVNQLNELLRKGKEQEGGER